jgi:hypothetical protein
MPPPSQRRALGKFWRNGRPAAAPLDYPPPLQVPAMQPNTNGIMH